MNLKKTKLQITHGVIINFSNFTLCNS